MNNKFIAIGLSVVAIVIAAYALTSSRPTAGNTTASFWDVASYVDAAGGFRVNGTEIISSALATAIGTLSTSGLFTANAGTIHSYPNSTSTIATAQTLIAADILNYDTVLMTPNIGALTLTFPASSTLSAFIPTAGDLVRQCWVNATGTAAATITFVAGTGIDLEVASSTSAAQGAPVLAIPADGGGCFTFIRKKATASAFDILALFTRFVDGD